MATTKGLSVTVEKSNGLIRILAIEAGAKKTVDLGGKKATLKRTLSDGLEVHIVAVGQKGSGVKISSTPPPKNALKGEPYILRGSIFQKTLQF